MYRKPRGSDSQSILNLDSLMDILSCLVGVMLFLVIYTVLELGATAFQVTIPVPLDRPSDSRRVLVLANGGTIRVLDSYRPVADLTTGIEAVPLAQTYEYVRQVNLSPPTDAHFRYALEYDEEMGLLQGPDSAFTIEIAELPGEVGESLAELDETSEYVRLLDELDPEEVWVEFGVDGASLDAFRRARDLAEQRGFATRWAPLVLEFPVRYTFTPEADGPGPRDLLSKPRR